MKLTDRRNADEPMVEGDVVALYGTDESNFRLAIAQDHERAVLIFDMSTGCVKNIINVINNVSKEEISLSTIKLPNEILMSKLTKDSYEIYNINIYRTPQLFEKTFSDFFDILQLNLRQLQSLVEGDIIKMHGLKLYDKYALYHHHAIYTDSKKCKIIHKWGELNKFEILRNVMGAEFENIGVREDNLIEVAAFREVTVSNCYDEKYRDQIRPGDQIVADARKRVGEKGYDIMTDNCQHFCTDCRYGIPVAIEIENTKVAVAMTVAGVSLLAGAAVGAWAAYKSRKNQVKKETS